MKGKAPPFHIFEAENNILSFTYPCQHALHATDVGHGCAKCASKLLGHINLLHRNGGSNLWLEKM